MEESNIPIEQLSKTEFKLQQEGIMNPLTTEDFEETIDPSNIDYIDSLDKYKDLLNEMLFTNQINHDYYDQEILKVNYTIDISNKTFYLSDAAKVKIDTVRNFKKILKDKYIIGEIDIEEYNKKYNEALQTEYKILLANESNPADYYKRTKVIPDIDKSFEEKIDNLIKEEYDYLRGIANKYKIPWPKKPKKKSTKEQLEQYEADLIIAQNLAKDNAPGYVVREIQYNYYGTETWKLVTPSRINLLDLKKPDKKFSLISEDQILYQDRLNFLKAQLRKLPRNKLLECVGEESVKLMSYIERLKENQVSVLKFKQYPKDYANLEIILREESINYYKIPSHELFNSFVYELTNTESFEPVKYVSQHLEKGQTIHLALDKDFFKRGKARKRITADISSTDHYKAIKPISDELYNELKTKQGSKTEAIKVWELQIPAPGYKKRAVILRYISFDNYLTELMSILEENLTVTKHLLSKQVLKDKIKKIRYYLQYHEDPDLIFPTEKQLPLAEIYDQRKKNSKG